MLTDNTSFGSGDGFDPMEPVTTTATVTRVPNPDAVNDGNFQRGRALGRRMSRQRRLTDGRGNNAGWAVRLW